MMNVVEILSVVEIILLWEKVLAHHSQGNLHSPEMFTYPYQVLFVHKSLKETAADSLTPVCQLLM